MSEKLNHDRRHFLAAATMTAAAVPLGVTGCAARRMAGAPGQLPVVG